ncbi:MAG: hypothetical protein AAF701_06900, partial [Pseudomonadota bacterium]
SLIAPQSAVIYAPPLPEVQFLVDGAADAHRHAGWGEGRTAAVLDVLADLRRRDDLRTGTVRIAP